MNSEERIWLEDEREIGGGISVHEDEPVYLDPYIKEYVPAYVYESRIEELEEEIRIYKELHAKSWNAAILTAANYVWSGPSPESPFDEWGDMKADTPERHAGMEVSSALYLAANRVRDLLRDEGEDNE